MRKEYEFSSARRSPYAARLRRQITIYLDRETIAYFKAMAASSSIPYQTLINLYLRDCAAAKRKLALKWAR